MTRDSFITDYWTYYLMLENKLITSFNYVELCDNNLSTYSNEYASLIQSIGSELDEFFKVYCSFPLHERKTINDYANYLFQNEPSIISVELLITGKNIPLYRFLHGIYHVHQNHFFGGRHLIILSIVVLLTFQMLL